METKELKIEVPEGFEIDKENSSFEKIVFKKKDSKPRSWDEYCESKMEKHEEGYFIDTVSEIHGCNWYCDIPDVWRNVLPSKELAEAFLAMMQLMSLRQAWIGDWKPEWNDSLLTKYCIICEYGTFDIYKYSLTPRSLSFPTEEMAEEFMNCFKDLLEIAKPLI